MTIDPVKVSSRPERPMVSALRVGSTLAGLAGVSMLIAGAWAWRSVSIAPPTESRLVFEPMMQDVGPVFEGEFRFVTFRVTNPNEARSYRVLGGESFCDAEGCIFWRGEPTTIPPGGSSKFQVEWKGLGAGRVDRKFSVYTDAPGQAIVQLTVSGDLMKTGPVALP